MRSHRAALIASGLFALCLLGDARAADHTDGLIELDVTQALVEAPPFPAAAVEIDAALRHPPNPVVPAGQVLLVLERAQSGTPPNDLATLGTFVDNGDVFGEPGDEASVDIRVEPESLPGGEYPQISSNEWRVLLRAGGGVSAWELQSWTPSRTGKEVSYNTDVILSDAAGEALGAVRIIFVFQVPPGQDLTFANLSITAPVTTGSETELHLLFELNQTGGSVDPGEPIYKFTMTSHTIPIPAIRPPYGPVLLGLLLVASALAVLRATRRRSS